MSCRTDGTRTAHRRTRLYARTASNRSEESRKTETGCFTDVDVEVETESGCFTDVDAEVETETGCFTDVDAEVERQRQDVLLTLMLK